MVRGEGDEKKKNKAGYAFTMVVCVCAVTMKKKERLLGHFVMSAEVKTMKSKVGTNQLPTN